MNSYFKLISHELHNKAELIKEYFKIHPGENGRNKEDLLASFLRSYLPKRYSLGTGFIFDVTGANSNQNDIIIYDSFWSSILFPNDVSQFYPIESVYGVVEVKSILNEKELKTSLSKAAKIKKMPLNGLSRVTGLNYLKEPLYSIFAYDSIGLKTIKDYLVQEYKNTPLNERVDFIVVINKGIFFTGNYFEVAKYGQIDSPYRIQLGAEGIAKIKAQYPSEIEAMKLDENSLLAWYLYLLSYLSLSSEKISNWIDYLEPNTKWGEFI